MSIPHKRIVHASQTKRKPFVDVSNTYTSYEDIVKKRRENEVIHMMPDSDCKLPSSDKVIPKTIYLQNLRFSEVQRRSGHRFYVLFGFATTL